ncbi:MAG: transcriptional repressor [Phycisphaeraceae bacterium]|nr:transcriptional repressor [Phycisphaeraceae bacterium]
MQRKTNQRQVIRAVLEASDRPLSAAEIHERAQSDLDSIGSATVYRAVNDLVDNGFLTPVELPGEAMRYELANLDHHHHFHCQACGRVFDVPGCPGNVSDLAPDDYQVDHHEIILYGRCPDCRTD